MADTYPNNWDDDSGSMPAISPRLQQLFQPQNTASQAYSNLANSMPVRPDPSGVQKLFAALAGLGAGASPVGIAHGQPIGFHFEPSSANLARNNVLYGDYDKKLVDWKNQLDAARSSAALESQRNVEGLSADKLQEMRDEFAAKTAEANRKIDISDRRANAYIFDKMHPKWNKTLLPGGNLIFTNPQDPTDTYDTGLASGHLSDADKEAWGLKAIAARGQAQAGVKATVPGAAPVPVTMPDPNDPTKEVTQIIKPTQGTITPVLTPTGQPAPGVQKLGTPKTTSSDITTSTKNLRDQAQLILPGIQRLKDSAVDLAANKDAFGVVMSRLRNAAGKIGTTGDDASIQKSLEQFNDEIKDLKNTSADFAVGKFLAELDLVASGVARAHGRSGAASLGMVQQMKQAMSASGTLDMFLGRLKAFDDQMRDYANVGIKTPQGQKLPIDKVLDDIFGPAPGTQKPKQQSMSFDDIIKEFNSANS